MSAWVAYLKPDQPSGDCWVKRRLARDDDREGKLRDSRLRTSQPGMGVLPQKPLKSVSEIPRVLVMD